MAFSLWLLNFHAFLDEPGKKTFLWFLNYHVITMAGDPLFPRILDVDGESGLRPYKLSFPWHQDLELEAKAG
jgi:hypothetical protein